MTNVTCALADTWSCILALNGANDAGSNRRRAKFLQALSDKTILITENVREELTGIDEKIIEEMEHCGCLCVTEDDTIIETANAVRMNAKEDGIYCDNSSVIKIKMVALARINRYIVISEESDILTMSYSAICRCNGVTHMSLDEFLDLHYHDY